MEKYLVYQYYSHKKIYQNFMEIYLKKLRSHNPLTKSDVEFLTIVLNNVIKRQKWYVCSSYEEELINYLWRLAVILSRKLSYYQKKTKKIITKTYLESKKAKKNLPLLSEECRNQLILNLAEIKNHIKLLRLTEPELLRKVQKQNYRTVRYRGFYINVIETCEASYDYWEGTSMISIPKMLCKLNALDKIWAVTTIVDLLPRWGFKE